MQIGAQPGVAGGVRNLGHGDDDAVDFTGRAAGQEHVEGGGHLATTETRSA